MIDKTEYLAPGTRACSGCLELLSLRLGLKVLGKNTIAVSPTGCMEVITSIYPENAWRIPWIHVAFENAAAVASGIEAALKSLGKKEKINVVVFAGDGGTADIGIQALSGMAERFHKVIYICTDNEAYMNTGRQRSSTTPLGASVTTAPAGKYSMGEDLPKKDMATIMAAHRIPYVATASIGYPMDYMRKVEKASKITTREHRGPSYIHVHCPCPTGWGFPSSDGIKVAKLAVQTGMWILYEVENGDYKITGIKGRKPVTEYLKLQTRFKHLFEREEGKEVINKIQTMVDEFASLFGLDA